MNMLTNTEGKSAVRLARESIESHLAGMPNPRIPDDAIFQQQRGVFVTLNTIKHELCGCIGVPYPVMSLADAILTSSKDAATKDPRFPPLSTKELQKIVIEVTILTTPEKLEGKPTELLEKIEIGRDGLIVKYGYYQGLLLPQVATEYNFTTEEFLSQTCMKAGLPPNCWLTGAEIYAFKGQIFGELTPGGSVQEKRLESVR